MTTPLVINDVIPRTQAIAIADQVTFNTNWTADASTDILVYRRHQDEIADDQTQLVSQDDYSVEFIGTLQTVRIIFSEGCEANDIVTISRDTPADKTNYYTNTNFTPSMLNNDFGILTLVDQQAQLYDQDLAPHYNISAKFTNSSDMEIDTILPILDANEFWVKNPSNTAIIKGILGSGDLPAAGPFITYTADDSLTGAFDLGLLANGILAQTVAAGISTPYILPIPMTVPNGGSGSTSFTAHSLLMSGTSSTSAFRPVSSGTVGQVLTSNGAGVDPSFETSSQIGTVNVIIYTANDTYTKPSNLVSLIIESIGGGGGGSGTSNAGATGILISGGGGAGGYSKSIYSAADVPASVAVTIGAAGSAGSSGANPGGTGGVSSFGVLCVSNGGVGSSSGVAGTGGLAGTGNYIAAPGSSGLGGVATSINTTTYYIGGGASSIWGSGGAPSNGATSSGNASSGYGAGGAGGVSTNAGGAQAGGAGSPGLIIATEYLSN